MTARAIEKHGPLAVCASTPAALDALTRLVREALDVEVLPIYDAGAVGATRELVRGYVGDDAACERLAGELARRPASVPLIVIGGEAARAASPTCWLLPPVSPSVLAALLRSVVAPAPELPSEPLIDPYRDAKVRFEQQYYSSVMRATRGNVSRAAKLAHKTRKEVYDALKRLKLDAAAWRSPSSRAP
jgi:hypothetical protein